MFVQRMTGEPLFTGPHGMITAGDLLLFTRQSAADHGQLAAVQTGGHMVLTLTGPEAEVPLNGVPHPPGDTTAIPVTVGIMTEIFSGIRDGTGLTDKLASILSFIRAATQKNGYSPSYAEIGEAVGIVKSVVQDRLLVLEEMGYVIATSGRSRSTVLAGGAVRSRQPAVADSSGSPRRLRGCPDVFVQRMTGNPLTHGPHGTISDRDVLLIQRQVTAAHGDLAAVLSDGRAVLTPVRENHASSRFTELHPDARVGDADHAVLLGVVVAVASRCSGLRPDPGAEDAERPSPCRPPRP
ncbi:LexA family protein [Streptomyces sp. NPDC058653]|uniref:LexA family protein n=1 Tax=Streptomyces sp. NPDC058653 TaxID=3346576 RepID=UPI003652592A